MSAFRKAFSLINSSIRFLLSGLMFLLTEPDQENVIKKVSGLLPAIRQ